ncbi:50S ribosomal protein L6 [bacterium]|nr:50S ribosomal protein L6 [bacterium]
MSRVGKLPVPITKGVTVELKGNHIVVSGPKGKLERDLHPAMEIEVTAEQVVVKPPKSNDRLFRGLFGLTRTLIYNMVKGVSDGFEKSLEIRGIGYRAQVTGAKLTLNVGYSHPVDYDAPAGITLEVPKPTIVVVKGIDKQLVGAVAAELRFVRKPEPYKGKGIRYEGEQVRTKVGKAGAGVGGKK